MLYVEIHLYFIRSLDVETDRTYLNTKRKFIVTGINYRGNKSVEIFFRFVASIEANHAIQFSKVCLQRPVQMITQKYAQSLHKCSTYTRRLSIFSIKKEILI